MHLATFFFFLLNTDNKRKGIVLHQFLLNNDNRRKVGSTPVFVNKLVVKLDFKWLATRIYSRRKMIQPHLLGIIS